MKLDYFFSESAKEEARPWRGRQNEVPIGKYTVCSGTVDFCEEICHILILLYTLKLINKLCGNCNFTTLAEFGNREDVEDISV